MQNLILQPTAIEQWQTLVHDAAKARGITFSQDLESYLVFLLQRFMVKPEMVERTVGFDYLQSHEAAGQRRQEQLQNVGDHCLLFAGLFPEHANRRCVTVTYFVQIGRQSYYLLSLTRQHARLFSALTEHFVQLMETLHCMRELDGMNLSLSPLQAEELWRTLGSKHALQVLQRYTQGFVASGESNKAHVH